MHSDVLIFEASPIQLGGGLHVFATARQYPLAAQVVFPQLQNTVFLVVAVVFTHVSTLVQILVEELHNSPFEHITLPQVQELALAAALLTDAHTEGGLQVLAEARQYWSAVHVLFPQKHAGVLEDEPLVFWQLFIVVHTPIIS